MDPVTALSTASCIVQIIDFGVRVVSKGNKIYLSIDGTLAETLDLELITNDLPPHSDEASTLDSGLGS